LKSDVINCSFRITGEEAVAKRKNILKNLSVAVTDMGNKIIRNGNSSLDENIITIEYMNIFTILKENPLINKIIFTSSSGKVNAVKWFSEFLKAENVIHKFPKGKKPLKNEIKFNDKAIQLVTLYFLSRRAVNKISFEKLVEMYKVDTVHNLQNLYLNVFGNLLINI